MLVQAAWQVSYIWAYMHSRGWVLPTVYQGMYNAITRDVERELLPGMIRTRLDLSVFLLGACRRLCLRL